MSNAEGKSDLNEFSDWVVDYSPRNLCQGYYVPPVAPEDQKKDFLNLPINLSADESLLTFEGQSVLRGNVVLQQGNRYLSADEVIIERSPSTKEFDYLLANGHIHYFAPGLNILGNRAEYFHLKQYFHMDDTAYRLYERHARGTASQIDIDTTNIKLKNANYTTCSPLSDTWLLSADDIVLTPKKGRATAKNIWLKLYDFPIFYFPYINYPIDNKRHSGFLFPNYGTTSNSGNEVIIPYYWNIAPNYDLTLAGRWLSERGLEAQSKFRYLWTHSEGTMQWHFLPYDRKYAQFSEDNFLSPPGDLSYRDPRIQGLSGDADRYAFNYRHATQWGNQWQMNIIFDIVSDDNYFVDLGNDINTASTIHLPQQANLSYYGDNWSHYFNFEEYQVLQPLSKPINKEIYKRQPQWVFQTLYPNLWFNLTFGLNGEIVNYNHEPDLILDEPVTTGQRFHLRPAISLPLQKNGFFFTPRVQLDWLQYTLHLGEEANIENLPQNPSRSIPLYDIDAGLFFERDIQYKNTHFIQTIEPRVYYLYVPFRDQHLYPNFDSGIMNFSYAQLFRDNRFSGRDRISDANQVTLSLTSRLFPAEGGQEWLRASIGQIFYFQNRKVSLCEELGKENICFLFEDPKVVSRHSNLIAQAEIHANSVWNGGFFWEWNSLHQQTEQAGLSAQYHLSNQKIINFNYYWQRHDIAQTDFISQTGSLHQTDIALFWPIHHHWQILSRWHYDLMNRQTVEILGGLEYNGCCIALQIVGSRYRQSNEFYYPEHFANGVFAQIVFKGLSAIGINNPDSKLKQKISGYIPLYDRQQWIAPQNKKLFPPEDIPLY